jgi:DNA-binding CsgD family transcriptional regulator
MIGFNQSPQRGELRSVDVRTIVQDQIREMVADLGPGPLRPGMPSTGPALVRLIAVGEDRYRLVVELLARSDGDVVPIATVERVPAGGVCQRTLRERYRLTEKEAHVAILLADRRSNAEIAETLRISPHTARRHTENVMLKLNVNSRFSVETALRAVA